MYPDFQYVVYDFFGINVPGLSAVKVYGFWLAMAFFSSAAYLTYELKRREKAGLMKGFPETVITGTPASVVDMFSNGLFGFVLGWKVLYFLMNAATIKDGMSFMFSLEGNWLVGALLGAGFAFWKYWEMKKQQLPEPVTSQVVVMPHERVSDLVILAAISGIAGAKVFFILEELPAFFKDPFGMFFSASGLAVYGGLIGGFFAVSFYIRRIGIDYRQMLDVAAPAIMLAYAVGRLGCHFSGDGCWGIVNELPNPGFLPDWLWAYDYPNSVSNGGAPEFRVLDDCNGMLALAPDGNPHEGFCTRLVKPVFPTSVYECVTCLSLFGVLAWLSPKLQHRTMLIFGIYMVMNGTERFLIEMIRVNQKYTMLGIHASQAQFIAIGIFSLGLALCAWVLWGKKKDEPASVQ